MDIATALDVRTDDLLHCRNSTGSVIDEIAAVLDSCSVHEAKIIADVVKSTKLALDKYL